MHGVERTIRKRSGCIYLMGGECDRDWDMYPERDAILIGTQDMFFPAR
jgi:hypothetical protein